MKIIFTGASSFTGFWFVRELQTAGHEVICTFTNPPESYQGLKLERLTKLTKLCQALYSSPFGSPSFLKLIASTRNIDILCHHGAQVNNYKSFAFPVVAAVAENTYNVVAVLEALKESGAKNLVLTTSVFAAGEGIGNNCSAVSPYGLSKGLSSEIFRFYGEALNFPLAKFVIPNPFGPLEEPRFVSYVMKQWLSKQVATINTPHYIRDNIHVSLLAKAYAHFVSRAATSTSKLCSNPSGYIMSQEAFTQKLAEEMRPRLQKDCAIAIASNGIYTEPAIRINSEPAVSLCSDWQEAQAFDALATYYLGLHHGI